MKSTGKRIMTVFIAAVMMLVMVPLLGTQKAYAEELIDFGNSYNCDWRYFKNASGKYVLHIGNMEGCDGDMGNYKLNSSYESTAAWTQYRDQVDELEFDGVTNIGDYAFYQFTKLSRVDLRDVKRIGDHAFYACTGLTSIRIDGDECVIENQAFDECWRNDIVMDEVSLEGVKTLGDHAFGEVDCWELNLGKGLESIGPSCFYCNEKIWGVTIPQSCKTIDRNAFYGCEKMEYAIILNPSCTIGELAFDKGTILGLKDSTAKTYADNNGIQFNAIGDVGSGEVDLTSGAADLDVDKFYGNDSTIEHTIEALVDHGVAAGKKENGKGTSVFYKIDANKDGSYDFALEWRESVIHPVTVLPECSAGGKITFNLPQTVLQACAEKGRPVYSTLTVKLPKLKNPMTVSAKTATVKYSKLKKKKQTLSAGKVLTIKSDKGSKSFKKLKGNKKITINKTTGKVTVKKGLKKGKYKIKVRVTAAGNDSYMEGAKTVTFTIRVK